MTNLSRNLPRNLASLALTGLLSTTLIACGSGDEAADDGFSVVLSGYPALPESVAWIVGNEQGFFADEGVQIDEFVGGSGGGASLRNLLATDSPLASVATSAAAESFGQDVPLVAVAGSGNNLASNLLVASADSGIESVDDLAGGQWRFGYTNPGSTTETMLDQAIAAWGLSEDEVETVSTGGTGEGVALLASGDIDVFTVPVSAYQGAEDQFGAVLASGADLAPDYTWSVLVTTPELLEDNREEITAVMRGLSTAIDYVEENPDEAAALWAAEAQIDEEVARATVDRMLEFDAFSRGGITDAGWQVAEEALTAQGIDTASLDGFFDPSVLEEIGQPVPEALQ